MTLCFYAKYHPEGIKSTFLCRYNQPDVWQELCNGLSIGPGWVKGFVSLYSYHRSNKKNIERFCEECKDLWESQLKSIVVPKMEMLFGCKIDDTIRCYVGLYPTYLRNIRRRYFLLPYGENNNRIREILIHELSHFYCYAACGDRLENDKLWRLSERIVPFILKYHFNTGYIGQSYVGEESKLDHSLFYSWASGKITFEKLVLSVK